MIIEVRMSPLDSGWRAALANFTDADTGSDGGKTGTDGGSKVAPRHAGGCLQKNH